MALKPCPECGNDTSVAAVFCPKCGHKLRYNQFERILLIFLGPLIILVLFGLLALAMAIFKPYG